LYKEEKGEEVGNAKRNEGQLISAGKKMYVRYSKHVHERQTGATEEKTEKDR